MAPLPSSHSHFRRLLPVLLAILTLSLGLAGCSPEASRSWGDGRASGADPNNWDDDGVVEMHPEQPAPDRIFYQTPRDLPGPGEGTGG